MISNTLPPIKFGEVPQILLLGNGINRCFDNISWDEVIEAISTRAYDEQKHLLKELPYPFQAVVYTDDCVKEGVEILANKLMPKPINEEQSILLRNLLEIPFDAILTSNYSYEIEQAVMPSFSCQMKRANIYRHMTMIGDKKEEELGFYKYFELKMQEEIYRIWHIHGEAARPRSMVLGHYEYGTVLSKAHQYIKDVIWRYKGCNARQVDFQPKSWIDYFLIGDIHIVGLGLDISEMDLWWLINCKKREHLSTGKIFFYEPCMDEDKYFSKKVLANAYRVEIVNKIPFNGNYKEFYEQVVKHIKSKLLRNS